MPKSGRFRPIADLQQLEKQMLNVETEPQAESTRSTSAHFPRETAKKKGPEKIRALAYGGAGGIGSDITLPRKVSLHRGLALRACAFEPRVRAVRGFPLPAVKSIKLKRPQMGPF
jgi:hypothetical protein